MLEILYFWDDKFKIGWTWPNIGEKSKTTYHFLWSSIFEWYNLKLRKNIKLQVSSWLSVGKFSTHLNTFHFSLIYYRKQYHRLKNSLIKSTAKNTEFFRWNWNEVLTVLILRKIIFYKYFGKIVEMVKF